MLIAILTGLFALVLTYMLVRKQPIGSSQLLETPAASLVTAATIICGDCCGDGEEPARTYLDSLGNCAQCGGRSYVFASDYSATAQPPTVAPVEEPAGKPEGVGAPQRWVWPIRLRPSPRLLRGPGAFGPQKVLNKGV